VDKNKEVIIAALNETGKFERVSVVYPDDFTVLPCAVISETKTPVWADDMVYRWNSQYNVYIWAKGAEEAEGLSEAVMEALHGIGLVVSSVADAPEAGLFRKTLGFYG